MGIGFDDGGSILDIQDALALYNIYYEQIRMSALTWVQLTGNIDAFKPIIAGSYNFYDTGHAVTIYGYIGSQGTLSNVVAWNSALNSGTGGVERITYQGGSFSDGAGKGFFWESTLSFQ